jgi:VanZ family protein
LTDIACSLSGRDAREAGAAAQAGRAWALAICYQPPMLAPPRLPLPVKTAVFALCFGVLAWLSLAPTNELPKVTLWDKAEHAIAYSVLTLVGAILFPDRNVRLVVGCMAFGILIEVLQATMGFGRDGDWRDAVANATGALVVVALIALGKRAVRLARA